MSAVVPYINREQLLEQAEVLLPVHEYNMLKIYVEDGKHELASDTMNRFFELYLNGTTPAEIHRLNKAFPYEAILWASIKYKWGEQKSQFYMDLQNSVKEKVIKAQLEATELLSTAVSVANKRFGDKFKKYLMTGDEKHLDGLEATTINSLGSLIKAIEGIQKATGQANTVTVKNKTETTTTNNVNLNVQSGNGSVSPDAAAQILKIIADEKRKSQ
jgi:hypothetical protein